MTKEEVDLEAGFRIKQWKDILLVALHTFTQTILLRQSEEIKKSIDPCACVANKILSFIFVDESKTFLVIRIDDCIVQKPF